MSFPGHKLELIKLQYIKKIYFVSMKLELKRYLKKKKKKACGICQWKLVTMPWIKKWRKNQFEKLLILFLYLCLVQNLIIRLKSGMTRKSLITCYWEQYKFQLCLKIWQVWMWNCSNNMKNYFIYAYLHYQQIKCRFENFVPSQCDIRISVVFFYVYFP